MHSIANLLVNVTFNNVYKAQCGYFFVKTSYFMDITDNKPQSLYFQLSNAVGIFFFSFPATSFVWVVCCI